MVGNRIHQLRTRNSTTTHRIEILSAALDDAAAENEKVRKDFDELRVVNRRLSAENASLREENRRVRAENSRLRQALDDYAIRTAAALPQYARREMTAGTCIGPGRRARVEPYQPHEETKP